jgi:hypothetical protein
MAEPLAQTVPPSSDVPSREVSPNHWSRWLPMITAMAVAVTPIGVATITSNVTAGTTNKDYVALAVSVLNSEHSSKPMRNWATNVLERLAPIPMNSATRNDFIAGDSNLSSSPDQSCGRIALPMALPSSAKAPSNTTPIFGGAASK